MAGHEKKFAEQFEGRFREQKPPGRRKPVLGGHTAGVVEETVQAELF